MDEEGQHLVAGVVAAPALAGAHRTLDDRIDDLQVGGIEAQHHMQIAARGLEVGGEAHVILDVTRLETGLRDPTLELVEESGGWLAEDIDEDIEPTPVGHADDDLLDPLAPGTLGQFVHQGNQGLATFQREALLADVAGMEIALHTLRGGEQGQQPAAIRGLQLRFAAVSLQALLYPALLLDAGDVHVLGADRTAIDLLKQGDDVAQPHPVRGIEGPGMEDLIQVGLPQLVKGRV